MSADLSPHPAQQLLKLLREQRDVFGQLGRLAKQQQTLVIDDDPEALLNLLAERQRLVDRLARLSQQMAPYRQRWPEIAPTLPGEDRQQAEEMLAEINGMLGSILASDKRDSRLLASRKSLMADELNDTHLGQRATQAYQSGLQKPSVLDTTDNSP